ERHGGVRALVVDGVVLVVLAVHDRDRRAVDVGADRGALRHVLGGAHPDHAPTLESLASIASPSRSRRSATGILDSSSAKKPRTTSLRASSSGMPRAIR